MSARIALNFIDKNKDKPFLCYVPFTTPHSPWTAPEEDWKRFKEMPITQRASDPKAEVDDHTRCALAMIENQDMNVGRVLAKLKADGVEENTIVVYFSDNGPNSHRWTGGMKGHRVALTKEACAPFATFDGLPRSQPDRPSPRSAVRSIYCQRLRIWRGSSGSATSRLMDVI